MASFADPIRALDELEKIARSGVTPSQLAADPSLFPHAARRVQQYINLTLSKKKNAFIPQVTPEDGPLPGSTFVFGFHTAQEEARLQFVEDEVARRTGTFDKVTSTSSTVSASGVRTPIESASSTISAAERQKIFDNYVTPLETLLTKATNVVTPTAVSPLSAAPNTIISGAGTRRRNRPRGTDQRQTILTGDSGGLSGVQSRGRTILG